MKKWLLLLIVFLLIGMGCIYFFIPNRIYINETMKIPVNAKGFSRVFSDENSWRGWWPGEAVKNSSLGANTQFHFNGKTYTVTGKRLTSFPLTIRYGKDSIPTELLFIPENPNVITLSWQAVKGTSYNPVKRLQRFNKAQELRKDLRTILKHLQKFYAEEQNVYGLSIKQGKVMDSLLISTSTITKGYPGVESVYNLIDQLTSFAQKQEAQATGLPMLNVNTSDSINYLVKVALPVNKKVKDEGAIVNRWMLGGGKILITEVKGGPHVISQAFKEMENYVQDFRRTAPAIPFQSLITDRRKEPDTNKWVTKIYWPVM
jgi:hypothetical protein